MSDEVVHMIDDRNWTGYCDATTGLGSPDRGEVTCPNCLAVLKEKP